MKQTKITLQESQIEFLGCFKEFGFKDKSEMMRIALNRFKEEIIAKQLRESAELYAEAYKEDGEMRELTESAISEWPE